MEHLYVCIMAGGSGERFWPLSRKATPKHLLRLFSERTMVEETVRRVARSVPLDRIFILTNAAQLEATRQAVPDLPQNHILAEPAKRDTAPACALGTALVRALDPQATIAFLPADALILDTETFCRQLEEAAMFVQQNDAILTFSITPSYPATGFGYLLLGEPVAGPGQTQFLQVNRFVEKPDTTTALAYLNTGHYGWNAGIFLWKSDVFLREAWAHQPDLASFVTRFPADPQRAMEFIAEEFPRLTKISIDYALMEKAAQVIAAKAEFDWDDVGLWTALAKHLPQDTHGNTVHGHTVFSDSTNNIVFAQKRLIALCGVNDLVVVETDDAILVCHRDEVQNVKKIHPQLPESFL